MFRWLRRVFYGWKPANRLERYYKRIGADRFGNMGTGRKAPVPPWIKMPKPITVPCVPVKSIGHLCFTSDLTVEFWRFDEQVYRAHVSTPIDALGVRPGRWECSLTSFEHFKSTIVW